MPECYTLFKFKWINIYHRVSETHLNMQKNTENKRAFSLEKLGGNPVER